jgi:hypothetical protein
MSDVGTRKSEARRQRIIGERETAYVVAFIVGSGNGERVGLASADRRVSRLHYGEILAKRQNQ